MNFDDCFPFRTAALYLSQCFIYLIQTEYSINRSFQRMLLVKQAGYFLQLTPVLMYKEEIIGLVLCRRHNTHKDFVILRNRYRKVQHFKICAFFVIMC